MNRLLNIDGLDRGLAVTEAQCARGISSRQMRQLAQFLLGRIHPADIDHQRCRRDQRHHGDGGEYGGRAALS